MEQQMELTASHRQVMHKKVRFLRRQGLIPANLCGHGLTSLPLQLEARTLSRVMALAGHNTIVSLRIEGGRPVPIFIREVQRAPETGELLHVELYQVAMMEEVRVEVPIHFVGESSAVEALGGTLIHSLDTLDVECLPANMPHRIEVDISALTHLEQSLHVRDLPPVPGVRILNDPEEVIAKVAAPRVVIEEVKPAPAPAPAEAAKPAEEVKSEEG